MSLTGNVGISLKLEYLADETTFRETDGDPNDLISRKVEGWIERVTLIQLQKVGGGGIVPTDWKRYRDDTFNIEENTEDQILNSFTEYLNSNILENKIKFTMETSSQELVFLDRKVHLKNGYLVPEIYSKPTDSHEYLNPKSCHPLQVTLNIPYSVALRVRRNYSDRDPGDKMFINNMVKYKAYLLESGYASDQIDEHFIKVAKVKRKHALSNKGGGGGEKVCSQEN